jgi:hypothetical protein
MTLLKVEKFKFNSASLTGSLQNFGTTLDNTALKVSFTNNSSVGCIIQTSDSNFVVELEPSSTLTFDEVYMKNNKQDAKYYLPKGAQLQIIQVTGAGSGNIIAHIVEER